jgi:hypothetical protein
MVAETHREPLVDLLLERSLDTMQMQKIAQPVGGYQQMLALKRGNEDVCPLHEPNKHVGCHVDVTIWEED